MNKADRAIADQIISEQITLMRFTAGERKRIFAVLLKMQTELKIKLQNGFTDYSKARMLKVLNQCTKVINDYYSGIQTELDLMGIAKHEAAATQKALATIGLDAAMPTASVLKAMVSDTLLQGAPLSAWWAKQAEDTAFKFASQVRQGVAQGETMQQIITRIVGSEKKGISGIMEVSRRNASTLVHDSVMQIANSSRMTTFKDNDDIIKGMQQLSTLDSHTSAICVAYSGAQWTLEGKPMGGNALPYNGGCPRHPNCRSVMVPLTKSYRELGIDIDEMKPGTRSSDLGQIPSDMSFEAFLKRHDKDYVDQLLGKGKAELYRSGKITLKDLIDGNGRELTLAQLKEAA
jgi:hypothetical protein